MSYMRYAVDKVTVKQDNVKLSGREVSIEVTKSIFIGETTTDDEKDMLYINSVNNILDVIDSLEKGKTFDKKDIKVEVTETKAEESVYDLF